MKIEKISNISYKARLVNREFVGKLAENSSHIYEKQKVSFVKIEPSNPDDIKALKEASDYWQNWQNGNLVTNIYYAACALGNESKYYKDHEVYALTSQALDYRELQSEKILGLIHTSPYIENSLLIEQLQANPQYLNERVPEYKGIGTAILNSLKFIADKISCYPSRTESVIGFYRKNGFEKQQNGLNLYIWNK